MTPRTKTLAQNRGIHILLPKNLNNITIVCGSDRAKWALDTVQLFREKALNSVAVATDGFRTVIAKWNDRPASLDYKDATKNVASTEANPNFEVLVPFKPYDEIFKVIPKKCKKSPALESVLLPETQVGASIPLETRDEEGAVNQILVKPLLPKDGKFPNWREAVPEYNVLESDENSKDAVRIRVDAKLLADLIKTVWQTAGKDCTHMDLIVPRNRLSMLEVRSHREEGISVTGFLTPINSPDSGTCFAGALPADKPAPKEIPVAIESLKSEAKIEETPKV